MSGLKIVQKDAGGNPTDDVCIDGYVAVTDKIILSPTGFSAFEGNGNPGARADYLQNVMTTHVPTCVVTTLTKDVAIDASNCHISAPADTDHVPGNKAKHSVPMPPTYLTSLGYLDEYIMGLHALVSSGDLNKARKYLYAVMMLTKCR